MLVPDLVQLMLQLSRKKIDEEYNQNLPIFVAVSLFKGRWKLHHPINRFGRKINIYYQPDLTWLKRIDNKRSFLKH